MQYSFSEKLMWFALAGRSFQYLETVYQIGFLNTSVNVFIAFFPSAGIIVYEQSVYKRCHWEELP